MKPTVSSLVCNSAWYTFGMKFIRRQSVLQGFTLIELLVTIAILTLLVSVIAVSSVESSKKSRDTERQADLRTLQSAIELYKNKYGRYPAGCNNVNQWSGQQGTTYACGSGNTQYIVGLAPEFIAVLPMDKKLNGNNSGYIYRTNTNGTVFKLKAHRTVESEVVDYTHKLKACDIRVGSDGFGNLLGSSQLREDIGWCGRDPGNNSVAAECKSTNDAFNKSYGVWGGFESIQGSDNGINNVHVSDTTEVICE